MPPYRELFPRASLVRVKDRAALEAFKREWRYHHPLTRNQLTFAGKDAVIVDVAYYHGGDVLYSLEGLPGLWHEQCLESPSSTSEPGRITEPEGHKTDPVKIRIAGPVESGLIFIFALGMPILWWSPFTWVKLAAIPTWVALMILGKGMRRHRGNCLVLAYLALEMVVYLAYALGAMYLRE